MIYSRHRIAVEVWDGDGEPAHVAKAREHNAKMHLAFGWSWTTLQFLIHHYRRERFSNRGGTFYLESLEDAMAEEHPNAEKILRYVQCLRAFIKAVTHDPTLDVRVSAMVAHNEWKIVCADLVVPV